VNLFGNKKGMILLIIAAICLFAFVVWPFVLGGRSNIQTEFLPMNVQMQEMISQTEEEPSP
jgi:competence protein ComEA